MRRPARDFILANTAVLAPPHVPEIRLHLAADAHELWQKTEEEMAAIGLPPPFWAFAWAGGQGLARFLLDRPGTVTGARVLDFATGSGLVAIAACLAGAESVEASDVDPWCAAAVELNSRLNNVEFGFRPDDLVGTDAGWDVVLAGDVFYDPGFAERLVQWFGGLASRGALVLVGDPGRSYCPKHLMEEQATYQVTVTRALEDAEVKRTTVWRFCRPPQGKPGAPGRTTSP